MEGLKQAFEYIASLKEASMEPKPIRINGDIYCEKGLKRYHNFPTAVELRVNTLTAVVDYIKGKRGELRETMILHVVSPTQVRLYSGLIDERIQSTLTCGVVDGFVGSLPIVSQIDCFVIEVKDFLTYTFVLLCFLQANFDRLCILGCLVSKLDDVGKLFFCLVKVFLCLLQLTT